MKRNATTPNAQLYSDDTASQSHSFPGTPDPQATQDTVSSNVPTQAKQTYQEHGSGFATRTHDESEGAVPSETSIAPTTIQVPTSASSNAHRTPTIISSTPQPGPLSPGIELQASTKCCANVDRTSQLAQTSRKTRTNTKTLRSTSGTEIRIGATLNTIDELKTTLNVAPTVSRKRQKGAREVQPTSIDRPHHEETDRNAQNQRPQGDSSHVTNLQVSAKSKGLSDPQNNTTNHRRVLAEESPNQNYAVLPANPVSTRIRSTRQKKQKKTAQEAAEEVVAEATGGDDRGRGEVNGRKRKRKVASEEAETHEIIPAEVRMADLIKDQGLGKTSKREAEMQKIDWADVKRKRRKAGEEALREEQKQKEARKNGRPLPPPGPLAAERLVLVNGEIVIDESSRVIDRNAETARDADQSGEAIDEDHLTKRVNQATVGRKPGTIRTYSIWDDEQTEQFYQGLRMFGTDFMMISKMFPDTSRAIIKKKYNKEEKLNPDKIFTALNSKEPVDLKAFSEMTDTVFGDPKDFYKELEEEQARLEAEDAKMRAEEAEIDQEIQESIEQDVEVEGTEGGQPGAEPSTRKNRFAAEARSILDGTDSRKRKTKKTHSGKKKEGKKGKGVPAEGTEEIVGRIEEVVA